MPGSDPQNWVSNWVSDLDSTSASVIGLSRFWNQSSKVSLLLNILNCDLCCCMYTLCHYISSRNPEDNIILLDLNTTGYVRLLVGDFTIIYEKLIMIAFAWGQVA